MNLANLDLGANIVNASSELAGCEAIHLLNDDMSQIWLSDDDIPQWLCVSLQYCTLLTPQTAYQNTLEIRTIGWYCWHPYLTNPKEVRLHVSRDSIKFKIWDTFIASGRKEGIQLFCCEPINIELYPYIALEIVSTFGGNQTYMNRLYLYTDEMTYASTSMTQTSSSSPTESSSSNEESSHRLSENIFNEGKNNAFAIDEAMVTTLNKVRKNRNNNQSRAVRIMSDIVEEDDENSKFDGTNESIHEMTIQHQLQNIYTAAIDGGRTRKKSQKIALTEDDDSNDEESDGNYSDDSLSTPHSDSSGRKSRGSNESSDSNDRDNDQVLHDYDYLYYGERKREENANDSPVIVRPPQNSYSNHYDHVPKEEDVKNAIQAMRSDDRIEPSKTLDPDLIVGRSTKRVLQSVESDNEETRLKVEKLHQALGIDREYEDADDGDDDENSNFDHSQQYHHHSHYMTSSFGTDRFGNNNNANVVHRVRHPSIPQVWSSNSLDDNTQPNITSSAVTLSTTNSYPSKSLDIPSRVVRYPPPREFKFNEDKLRTSTHLPLPPHPVAHSILQENGQEAQGQSIVRTTEPSISNNTGDMKGKKKVLNGNESITTPISISMETPVPKSISFSLATTDSNAESLFSERNNISTFLSRSHPVIDQLQQQHQVSSYSLYQSSSLSTPAPSTQLHLVEKSATRHHSVSEQQTEVVTASGGSNKSGNSASSNQSDMESILDQRLITVEEKCDRIMQLLETKLNPPTPQSQPVQANVTSNSKDIVSFLTSPQVNNEESKTSPTHKPPIISRDDIVDRTFSSTLTTVVSTESPAPGRIPTVMNSKAINTEEVIHQEGQTFPGYNPVPSIARRVDESCQTWEDEIGIIAHSKPVQPVVMATNTIAMTTKELDTYTVPPETRVYHIENGNPVKHGRKIFSHSFSTQRSMLSESQQSALNKINRIKEELQQQDSDDDKDISHIPSKYNDSRERRHRKSHHHKERKSKEENKECRNNSSSKSTENTISQEVIEYRTKRTEQLLEEILGDLRSKARQSVLHSSKMSPPKSSLSRVVTLTKLQAYPQLDDEAIPYLVKELQHKVMLRTMKEAQLRILAKASTHY